MKSDRTVSAQRYRSLVLSHIYILARRAGMPIGRLPQETLGGLGIEKRTDAASATTFVVKIPADLQSPAVAAMLGRFEQDVRENGHLFPKAACVGDGHGEGKRVSFRPRKGPGKREADGWEAEPLDEKALLRMADAP